MANIILASRSPRRKQLLEWAEINFEILAEETDEYFLPGTKPETAVIDIARTKAMAVRKKAGNKIIIAADTTVVLKNEIIGKPQNTDDAINILKKLNGQNHKVITGVYISNLEKEVFFSDSTEVEFHLLTDEQINYYVNKYHPLDKAGAYAIQEWIGVVGIKSISGDFYNVMGLPISRVVQAISKFIPDYR